MADELLTVAEAAVRLGVSIPRLRRWLARPENVSFSFSMQRETRTGTRMAIVVSVTVMPQIEKEIKQERKQKRVQTALSAESETVAHLKALLCEKDARIAELTEALKHERERNRKPVWLRWFRVQ